MCDFIIFKKKGYLVCSEKIGNWEVVVAKCDVCPNFHIGLMEMDTKDLHKMIDTVETKDEAIRIFKEEIKQLKDG